MVDGMMRKKPGASMLAIAPNQNKFARIFMREIHEPYGKVFLKFFGLTHEHPEFMFFIRGPKSHFIPLHFAFKLHLPTWRINHFLTAGNQIGNVLLCKY